MAGQRVVPGAEQLGRGDVVVVDHQALGPPGEPPGEVRGGGELVDEHVAGPGPRRVGGGGLGERLGLGVDQLDVDRRVDAGGPQEVGHGQRVLAHGVAPVEHGHELVDPARHDRRAPTA